MQLVLDVVSNVLRVGQIDQIDHDLDQIDQIDHDLHHLDPNLPL